MPSKRDARNYSAPSSELAYLGLHQAALSGNVGLVKYALQQGQPVDAVRDGVSALHAAAAGGSEHVARLLVESGADVSFGRLPRTEREMKTRTASSSSNPPMENTSGPGSRSPREPKPRSLSSSSFSTPDSLLALGSTPLHFACAYNNPAVARVLLAAGAAPHIRDKAGHTPLDLLPPPPASDSSSTTSTLTTPSTTSTTTTTTTAPPALTPREDLRAAIREYYEAAKAREKEERDGIGRGVFASKAAAVLGFPEADPSAPLPRKSMENMRAARSPKHVPPPLAPHPHTHTHTHSHTPPPSPRRPTPTPPASPARFTFGTPPSFVTAATHSSTPPPPLPLEQRRPSLPHLFAPAPPSPPTPSPPPPPPPVPHATATMPPSARRPLYTASVSSSSASQHHSRPRSAGSGASSAPAFGSTAPRPPRTKRSLLRLFMRGDCEEEERERERGRERGRGRARDLDEEWARERERLVGGGGGGGLQPLPPLPPPMLPPPLLPLPLSSSAGGVHTAPPGRTTFGDGGDGEEEEEEEEYGVVLTRTPDVMPAELLDSSDDEEEEEDGAGGVYDEDDDAEREEHGEGEGEDDEDAFTDEDEDDDGDTAEAAGHFVPPAHAEAWYRDRARARQRFGESVSASASGHSPRVPDTPPPLPSTTTTSGATTTTITPTTPTTITTAPTITSTTPTFTPTTTTTTPTTPRYPGSIAGILRTERGVVRQTASRGALRFDDDSRVRGDSVSSGSTTDAPRSPGGDALAIMGGVAGGEGDEGEGDGEGDEGLSVRTVSSHAQAEALVQKAAKEILLEQHEHHGEGGVPMERFLAARLAAYGETLQLERRFARGEAQRWKSPVKERFGGGVGGGGGGGGGVYEEGGGEGEREGDGEERRRRERMVRSQREMDRYASAREREREKEVPAPGRAGAAKALEGAPLERTASLEKELEPRRRPRAQKIRRPHTSDSGASGNVAPPRFGHSTTYSATGLLWGPVDDSLRGFARHHASRSASASAHPRAESFDHVRALGGDGDEDDAGSLRTGAGSTRSALEEFGGSTTTSGSIRVPPLPHTTTTTTTKRFGGLRSLFGKGRQ